MVLLPPLSIRLPCCLPGPLAAWHCVQPRAEKIGTIWALNDTWLGSIGAPTPTLPSAIVTTPAATGRFGMSIVVVALRAWLRPTSPAGTSKNTAQPDDELAVAVVAAIMFGSRKRGPLVPAIVKSVAATPASGLPLASSRWSSTMPLLGDGATLNAVARPVTNVSLTTGSLRPSTLSTVTTTWLRVDRCPAATASMPNAEFGATLVSVNDAPWRSTVGSGATPEIVRSVATTGAPVWKSTTCPWMATGPGSAVSSALPALSKVQPVQTRAAEIMQRASMRAPSRSVACGDTAPRGSQVSARRALCRQDPPADDVPMSRCAIRAQRAARHAAV